MSENTHTIVTRYLELKRLFAERRSGKGHVDTGETMVGQAALLTLLLRDLNGELRDSNVPEGVVDQVIQGILNELELSIGRWRPQTGSAPNAAFLAGAAGVGHVEDTRAAEAPPVAPKRTLMKKAVRPPPGPPLPRRTTQEVQAEMASAFGQRAARAGELGSMAARVLAMTPKSESGQGGGAAGGSGGQGAG